ncbi:MAG: TadE/TadG family type IV pilus assembly protein [Acidimicrobiales bacterium]
MRRHRRDDERGAELIEFAIVVVLLVVLLYGIVSVGVTLAAKATITQAAEDGARAGVVDTSASAAIAAAESQASSDVAWMGQGPCGTSGTTITCVASAAPCVSNTTNTCLTVTVTYNYADHPLFPVLPGLGILAPTTIASTAVLQVSNPPS